MSSHSVIVSGWWSGHRFNTFSLSVKEGWTWEAVWCHLCALFPKSFTQFFVQSFESLSIWHYLSIKNLHWLINIWAKSTRNSILEISILVNQDRARPIRLPEKVWMNSLLLFPYWARVRLYTFRWVYGQLVPTYFSKLGHLNFSRKCKPVRMQR